MTKRYTREEFSQYVLGWLESEQYHMDALDMENIKSALANTLAMIEDYQDGIEYYVERNADKN